MVAAPRGRPAGRSHPLHQLVFRLGGRALTLYAAHMMIVMLAIAMLAGAARVLDNPLLLEWHNAAAVFNEPVETHIGLVLLSHQLGYFDILPLYVVLMLLAPVIAFVHRTRPICWCRYRWRSISRPTSSSSRSRPGRPRANGFQPALLAAVFVLGFAFSRERGAGGWVNSNIAWLRLVARPS